MSSACIAPPETAANDTVTVAAGQTVTPDLSLASLPHDMLCGILALAMSWDHTGPDAVRMRETFGTTRMPVMALKGVLAVRKLCKSFRGAFCMHTGEWARIQVSLRQADTLKQIGVAAPLSVTHRASYFDVNTMLSLVRYRYPGIQTLVLTATHVGGALDNSTFPRHIKELTVVQKPVVALSTEDVKRMQTMPRFNIKLGPNFHTLTRLLVARPNYDPTPLFCSPTELPNLVALNVIGCGAMTGDGVQSRQRLHHTGSVTRVLRLPPKVCNLAFAVYIIDGELGVEGGKVDVLTLRLGGSKAHLEATLGSFTAADGTLIKCVSVLSMMPTCISLDVPTHTSRLTMDGFIPGVVSPDVRSLNVNISNTHGGPVAFIVPTNHVTTLAVCGPSAVCVALLGAHTGLEAAHITPPDHEAVTTRPHSRQRICSGPGFRHSHVTTLSIRAPALGEDPFLELLLKFPHLTEVTILQFSDFTASTFVGSVPTGPAKRAAIATWAPCAVTICQDAANPHPTPLQLQRLTTIIPHLVVSSESLPPWAHVATLRNTWHTM
jgi:hypothetical protein